MVSNTDALVIGITFLAVALTFALSVSASASFKRIKASKLEKQTIVKNSMLVSHNQVQDSFLKDCDDQDPSLLFAYEACLDNNAYTSDKTICEIIRDGTDSLHANKTAFVYSVFPELGQK